MTENSQKIVGVLGGLGPDATVDFVAKVVAATEADTDQGHIRMLVDHNPKVPNRHSAIAGKTASVGPELAAMAKGLEKAGADFLVMVCNSAHAYAADIRAAINIPFISIIDVTVEALQAHEYKHIGIMAADGCLRAELYQQALVAAGYEPVLWTDRQLAEFMSLVYRIKAGEKDEDISTGLARLATALAFDGAEAIISGCTEIPLFMSDSRSPLPLLESTNLLVQRTIELAGGTLKCY